MIRALALLTRPRVCLLATLACLAGYALQRPTLDLRLLAVCAACYALATACSALNQAQERARDALMRRTQNRPLPTGALTLRQALLVVGILLFTACVLLGSLGATPLGLGLLAVLVYNGVYTPLKPRTSFALLAGGLAGALPPLIGWSAAGGALLDFRILAVASACYMWQTPHFWFLAARHEAEYRAAGFKLAPRPPLLAWLAGLSCAMLLLPAFGALGPAAGALVTLLAGGNLLASRHRASFALSNLSMLLFLTAVATDSFWRGLA